MLHRSAARTAGRAGGLAGSSPAPLPHALRTRMAAPAVDQTLNPAVAGLKPSKTMALTDLATSMKEKGIDVIGLAAGEPDFDTPAEIVEAGVEALRKGLTRYTPNTGASPSATSSSSLAALRKRVAPPLRPVAPKNHRRRSALKSPPPAPAPPPPQAPASCAPPSPRS